MSVQAEDPRRAEALAMDIAQIADHLAIQGLRRAGREMTGPCPRCGGNDRFSLNTAKRVFNCRHCGGSGGNIDLVMFVLGLQFRSALDWLCGERQELSAAERAERLRRAEDNRARNEARAERERQARIAEARAIWTAALPPEDTIVRDYLTLRGIPRPLFPALPVCLRFHPDLPYMVQVDRGWVEAWRGPAMLAAMQAPDARFRGVHRTWIDLARPKGKPLIVHPETGEILKVKKTLGSLKGCAIRLTGRAGVMVMGEGIETTLTALIAGVPPGAAFWSGISLGNMAGRRRLGPGLKYAGLPDLEDPEAWRPPPEVERLIFVMDGDSEPRLTRAQLQAGLRRAMALRPGLKAQIVHPGEGMDLNDIIMEQPHG